MRSLALQSVVVAAVAISAVGGSPVDDEGQTNNYAPITIPVLINDPAGTELLGVIDPASGDTVASATLTGGATVTVTGDQIQYNPNGNLPSNGRDSFSYMTDCGEANVVIAVTPGANVDGSRDTTAPVDDTAVTRPDSLVRIDVLLNDPQFSQITGIISNGVATPPPVTLPSGGIVNFEDDDPSTGNVIGEGLLTYTPPAGLGTTADATDSFQYTTQGGTANVKVTISNTAAPPSGGPVDDIADTDFETSVRIDPLANDPPGTLLLGISDPSLGRPDNGTARIEGNYVVFTPDVDRGDNPPYAVEVQYKTNNGTGTITINVGTINQGLAQGQIRIFNATRFLIRLRVDSQPGVFFEDCNTGNPRATQVIAAGNPLANPPTENMEPMANEVLCVGLLSGIIDEFDVTAEIIGSTTIETTTAQCPVFALPNGAEQALVIQENLDIFGQVVAITINCPYTPAAAPTP